MPRKKADKYDLLKSSLVDEMKERNTYKPTDEHLIDNYISQLKIIDAVLMRSGTKL